MKTSFTLSEIFDTINKRFDEQSKINEYGTLKADKRIARMEALQEIKKDFYELTYGCMPKAN